MNHFKFCNIILFILVILFSLTSETNLFGQVIFPGNEIYKLEYRLLDGDKKALFEIGTYFDSTRITGELSRYPISELAKEITERSTSFTENEILINKDTGAKEFLDFLNLNEEKIYFSQLVKSFIITPFAERKSEFIIRPITEEKKSELKEESLKILRSEWVKISKVDSLLNLKNPKILLTIASELFKESRHNTYSNDRQEFLDLIQFLTGYEIGLKNNQKKFSWYLENDFNSELKLNLLIFFSKFYDKYSWDVNESKFINPDLAVGSIDNVTLLFKQLESKNDSVAINAFIQLTTCDTAQVINAAEEYDKLYKHKNYSLPTFPYRFLKQLVKLTEYCRNNDIDFKGSPELQKDIELLRSELDFSTRRKIENRLINNLTLNEITALEYWSLIYENGWGLTFSVGRILDVFYSKNWKNLLSDKKHLDCYLKKSKLFNEVGIIGICNNYLKKFYNLSQKTLNYLKSYDTSDNDISIQISKILSSDIKGKIVKKVITWEGNRDNALVTDLQEQLEDLITETDQDSSKNIDKILTLLSKINYEQIPIALKSIQDYNMYFPNDKYSFMDRDFGFFMTGKFEEKKNRTEFLKIYLKYSEYQLYTYYLDLAEINYKSANNNLDYDKIYDLIKYDVVTAFVGGGGGGKDNEVYSLIKLLELTFKTTLGFPHKLCNSADLYGCDSENRAEAWMQYLEVKNLLKEKHDEPVSFHFRIE